MIVKIKSLEKKMLAEQGVVFSMVKKKPTRFILDWPHFGQSWSLC